MFIVLVIIRFIILVLKMICNVITVNNKDYKFEILAYNMHLLHAHTPTHTHIHTHRHDNVRALVLIGNTVIKVNFFSLKYFTPESL